MELLDRYLQAVGFWLPRKQRQDILAELAEDLQSQIEETEASLGHKLSEAELEALLKQRGRPVLVANRYLPQRYLIGPLLFPVYRLVLIIVGLCYLVPWILVAIGLMSFSPAYRAEQTQAGWLHGLLSIWSSFWLTALINLAVVAIVFAVLERVNAKSRFLEEWEPRKLPAVRDRNQIPRSSSIFELAGLMAFCVWWITYMWSPVVVNRPDVRIVFSPVWPYFFWGLGLVALACIPVSAVNLVRPYWTPVRALLRLLTDLAGSAFFCWALKARILAEITVANTPRARAVEITNLINAWAERAFPVALIVVVVVLCVDVYRIIRVKQAGHPAIGAPGHRNLVTG